MSIIKPTDNYYNLFTDRLLFVPLKEKHIDVWANFFVDNPTERFLGFEGSTKTPFEKAELWINKQIERRTNNEFGQLAIIEKKSGQFIGLGGIISRNINNKQEFEITYSILKNYWGIGYATELAIFFRDFMFIEKNCFSVISIIHVDNEASINVARKNGMSVSSETTFMDMPVYIFRIVNDMHKSQQVNC